MLVRVAGTVLELRDSADVLFEDGIDSLKHFHTGDKFSVEVEVIERDGRRMSVKPVGLTSVDR